MLTLLKLNSGHGLANLDGLGMQPFDLSHRLVLIEDRQSRASTIIYSQLAVNSWHDIIGEETIADVILDRLAQTARPMELKGESQGKKN